MAVTKKEENNRLTVGFEEHHKLLKRTTDLERQLALLRKEHKQCHDNYMKLLAQGGSHSLPASVLLGLDDLLKGIPIQELAEDLQEVIHLAVVHGGAEYGLDEQHVANLDTVFKLQKLFRRGAVKQRQMAAA